MLNVINGVYHPQQGRIVFRGQERRQMHPTAAARQGIARTFQNIALFKGMTVLDNIMTGRNTKIRTGCSRTRCGGAGAREEMRTAARSRRSSTSSKSRRSARPRSAACPTACRSAWSWRARWPPSRRCCCSTSRWPA
jgi:ABC-type branched-subunit amino acid transport system ATPase component